jgi:hypothetical protein
MVKTKPCTCYILRGQIIYCPMHLAAPDMLEALAGWMATAGINGTYLPGDMRDWAITTILGKTRTLEEVTRSIMEQLEVTIHGQSKTQQ